MQPLYLKSIYKRRWRLWSTLKHFLYLMLYSLLDANFWSHSNNMIFNTILVHCVARCNKGMLNINMVNGSANGLIVIEFKLNFCTRDVSKLTRLSSPFIYVYFERLGGWV